jgi:hypothetical protein
VSEKELAQKLSAMARRKLMTDAVLSTAVKEVIPAAAVGLGPVAVAAAAPVAFVAAPAIAVVGLIGLVIARAVIASEQSKG